MDWIVDAVRGAVLWLATRPGIATLEYLGGLFIGQEVLAISVGEARVKRLAGRLDAFAESLGARNVDRLIDDISRRRLGPVLAGVLYSSSAAVFLFEMIASFLAGPFASPPTSGLALLLYRIRMSISRNQDPAIPYDLIAAMSVALVYVVLLLPVPAVLYGAARAVHQRYRARRVADPLGELLEGVPTPKPGQFGSANPLADVTGAFAKWIGQASIRAGEAAGRFAYSVTLGLLRRALLVLSKILDRGALRRAGVLIGLVMLTLAYVLKLMEDPAEP